MEVCDWVLGEDFLLDESFENIVMEEKEDRVEYWSYYYLGNIYKSKGNYEKAREAYDKAEDTDDNWLLENIEDERKELEGS